ncbi:MAG: BrnA antitoxin family protein [Candidatus Nomurabacteria bacterium]|jgi:uncharacterized protein (DUF4415 family)|nr:BrnA antitoxin family protein [Candidatus Nomurabacteria bacterium]
MNKPKYTDAPADIEESLDYLLANPSKAEDALPPPEYFAKMLAKEKISLNIDTKTVASFRAYAKANGLKYQVLMNQVLSRYAEKQLR